MNADTVDAFAYLFQGRLDAYGTEQGGCDRNTSGDWDAYRTRVIEHLYGDTPMGVYPMVLEHDEFRVSWGCVDFDEGDEVSWIHSRNLHTALSTFGIQGWIERSRSKGFHVWVFCDDWVPASTMREALLGACQIVGAPTKEINPKQTELRISDDGSLQLGNYVRLPYPHGYENGERRCVVDLDGSMIGLDRFCDTALDSTVVAADLEPLVAVYEPPAKPKPAVVPYISEPATMRSGMKALSRHILNNGPKEGGDRSSTLYALAQSLHRDGLTYSEAIDVIYDADRRWGKHIERGDPEYLDRMCAKVWGQ